MEEKEQKTKKRRKLDKSQIAIKIVALILTLAFIIPMIASTIIYFVGE